MKRVLYLILSVLFMSSCGDGNVLIQEDPSIQKAIDIDLIEDYLADKGYNDFDTTLSGVRYIILDQGSGQAIDESDHVEFHYTGFTLSDTIFDTSIKEVGDSLKAHYTENPIIIDGKGFTVFGNISYTPTKITYSKSGWTLPKATSTTPGFIPGYVDGIVATFKHLNVGGSSLILIPSNLAYGQNGEGYFIAPNTPIAFELYPIKVTKQ
ncbi:MAG: FKBP-type peptidyl-prolyl cis-trans isomerase [Ekhidna sp.]|uniref:FKBP-type peptidyl-prolyl cis-trans isomerase n=1 Tax=Ekhidna sp. TaxID=2608089 RepID=UPI0032EBEF33